MAMETVTVRGSLRHRASRHLRHLPADGVRRAAQLSRTVLAAATLAALVGCGDRTSTSEATDSPLQSIARGSIPVISVVDGDTIHVLRRGSDVTVRLIGIDSPEVSWYGGEGECYGAQAGRFARALMDGKRVILELDEERLDPYGRLLAYVSLESARMVNVVLVRRGFATVTIYPPNDRYEDRLRAAEDAARAEGAGLWSACRSG
jgi:micrococcal nuclease